VRLLKFLIVLSFLVTPAHAQDIWTDGTGEVHIQGFFSTIRDGKRDVRYAGTATVLSDTPITCKRITITARYSNLGIIAAGDTSVSATVLSVRGVTLYAGDSYTVDISNLNKIYLDSTVENEGVSYTYYN